MNKSVHFYFAGILLYFCNGYGLSWPFFSTTSTDKLGLTKVVVNTIEYPASIQELQNIIKNTQTPVSVLGECYSQGGQTAYPNGTVINMKHLNKIIELDRTKKIITVQAGATWHKIQQYIDPYDLSVQIMQSYNNFSVGGSLSVNAHSRNIVHGPIIDTVLSLQMILADGSLITTDRQHNSDLFYAAIGGYGLMGTITQATLKLTDNITLERHTQKCPIKNVNRIYFNTIQPDKSVVFYNADLFPNKYRDCLVTTWHTTQKQPTVTNRLQPQNSPFYIFDKALDFSMRRIPFAKNIRPLFEDIKSATPRIVWQNYEMSYSVHQLATQIHFPTAMTLQEYFIPVSHAQSFIKKLRSILKKYKPNVLNISIRHVAVDACPIMSYAPQESFSFVLYFNIFNTQKGQDNTCVWTRKIIDTALKYNGSYFLPYLMCATKEQFDKAYPNFQQLLTIKKKYDPHNKFRNMLLKKYNE